MLSTAYPPASPTLSSATDIVELVVFTTDGGFLQTLRDALGASRRLWHVPSAGHVGDMLAVGEVGILILDVSEQPALGGAFVARLKDRFPALILLVAGNRSNETSMARLISAGTIYRFVHKPLSPGRAKLFVDAAVKRHAEQSRPPRTPVPPKKLQRHKAWPISKFARAVTGVVIVTAALWGAARAFNRAEIGAPTTAQPQPLKPPSFGPAAPT